MTTKKTGGLLRLEAGRPDVFYVTFSLRPDSHASDVLAIRVPSIHVLATRAGACAPAGDTILVNGNGRL